MAEKSSIFLDIVSCVYISVNKSSMRITCTVYLYKSEHNENHHLSLPWVYISWVSLWEESVSVHVVMFHCLYTDSETHGGGCVRNI